MQISKALKQNLEETKESIYKLQYKLDDSVEVFRK